MAAALICLASPASAEDNRATVAAFAERFYRDRDVAGAFADHVAPDYIQHNPGLPDGRQAAVDALAPMFARPGSRFDVRHLLVDGDLALVHLFGQGDPATPGAAVADIYRLEKGQIVEHWDVLQPIAAGSDPLAAATRPVAPPMRSTTTHNRQRFTTFVDLLLNRKRPDEAYSRFAASDMTQHNQRLGQGRDATIAALKTLFANPEASFTVERILVDGDLAAVHYRGRLSRDDRGAAVVELFRFADGKIVEHWDVFQPMPERSLNPHPMF
ncbi:putative SnoaL-like aldol condensation-catalyzing enzyme [Sphingomonas zeicaulis]|uniref:nuclear transport factor 2 family protein n=1 Tax=Sphingomonas zeicaulis TaxID=1632740 RepID=UPI003D242F88